MQLRQSVFAVIACAALSAQSQANELNRVPNAGFSGDRGQVLGNVTGTIPDYWRAFALEGDGLAVSIVPLAPNTLFPGSPATNAVRLTRTAGGGSSAFDHEANVFGLNPGHNYKAQVYMRSGNSGGAAQAVEVAFPVFNVDGFTGRQPGRFEATVGSGWTRYSGPAFMEADGTGADLSFRLQDDGGENSILIAMPTVNGPAYEVPAVSYPPVYTPGRDFSNTDRYVATSVFLWFTVNTGQLYGPWGPLGGRGNWTGEAPWWREQIKDMMDANIDVLYVANNGFFYQREQLFKALAQLRREGYDTPYVLPFLTPESIWFDDPIDMSQEAAKDEYMEWYRYWFEQYFEQDTGDYAESRLLHINGKVVLNTWHSNPGRTDNLDSLTRNDVESRLSDYFGDTYPSFNNGIYQIATTNGISPSFSDEIAHQFSNAEYFSTHTFNNKRPATVIGGIWDQNIRDPGLFYPRDGGVHYVEAWEALNATRNGGGGQLPVYHAYVESWNEYDEGTGIYEGDTEAPFIAPENQSGNDDFWSTTDNPREYIDTTYAGATDFNDHPLRDSRFLWNDFPASMAPGESATVQVLVRNEGDAKWSQSAGYRLSEVANGHAWGPANIQIDDADNEIARYGGVFRGRPVLFEFTITAPNAPGVYEAQFSMTRSGGGAFGETLTIQVAVGEEEVGEAHSAAFFNPARDGEGNYVEILNENQALVYTFSYRPDGSGPAWFLGVGDIEGGSIVINDLLRPIGAEFGAGFDSADISYDPAGSMSMGFVDCPSSGNGGTVSYSGSEALGYEALLSRAARLSEIIACDGSRNENAHRSGSFFSPERDGEGIVVEWLNGGLVLVIMFTYDLEGDQFWVLGIGTPDGDSVTMEAMYPATPTSWGSGFNPDEIRLESWGTFTLEWDEECDSVAFSYASTVPGYGSANRNYSRLTGLAGLSCP